MAILPVTSDDVEFSTTIINPIREFASSSSGVTGSLRLFPRGSTIEKEIRPLGNFASSSMKDDDIDLFRREAISAVQTVGTGSALPVLEKYLQEVNQQSSSVKKQQKINIIRFTPGVDFASNFLKKLNVKDLLMPYYRTSYPTAQWAYTNYNDLNFFAASTVPTSSVLLYPNIDNTQTPSHAGYVSGTYSLSGAFSFDFHINPRYKEDGIDTGHFKAGTIFHLSSSYALSLITGSKKDENGLPTTFRLQLQLSHSADIAPSKAIKGSYPNDLIFLSDDNSLDWNKWQRVVVRWGTNLINDGTGSFNIDGVDKGTFVVPSGTIAPKTFALPLDNPRVLCVGNFYEGSNSGSSYQAYFFSDVVASRDGLQELVNSSATQDQPVSYSFKHPLKAEVHELMIRREYLTNNQIQQTSGSGLGTIDATKMAFYAPPFFIENTPIRRYTAGPTTYGGILQTPFFEIDGSTNDPFNVAMAYGVDGHYINLENFVKDFANDVFPRLHHMSGTAITYSTTAQPASDILYSDPFVRRRNLLIMPCDEGNFSPDYSLLAAQSGSKHTDSFGRLDYSIISLDNLLSTASLVLGSTYDTDYDSSLVDELIGPTPENPGLAPGAALLNKKSEIEKTISTDEAAYDPGVQKDVPLTIFQRTKDPSSNQVTLFNISNLYYGSRILPGTFQVTDSSLTGSANRISVTLKDDGAGNIYRADALTPQCTWNSVGNIFYNEGVVLIKSPHLYFFGKDQYEMSFQGEYQMHTSKYEILAPSGLLNSSSNPTYAKVETAISASADPLDNDAFIYISNINFHDENLNVVAKASLAQPIIKREGEKILFKVGFDF